MDSVAEWAKDGEAIAVSVVEREGRTAQGTVYLRVLDKPDRTKRAALSLAICWGLALASFPIMFFHFFLVPLFGILGPVLFFVRMKQESTVLGAMVDCPSCSATSELGKQAAGWPLLASCSECRTRLTIQPEDEGTA